MFCPKCGREIANDSAFCEYCGAKIGGKLDSRIHVRWLYFVSSLLVTWTSILLLTIYSDLYWESRSSYGWYVMEEMSEIYYTVGLVALAVLATLSIVQAAKKQIRWNDSIVVIVLFLANLISWNEVGLFNVSTTFQFLSVFSIVLTIYYLIFNYIVYRKTKQAK